MRYSLMLLVFLYPSISNAQQVAAAFSSPQHPILNALVQQHANKMATICYQSHNGWEYRYRAALKVISTARTASEICAESWPWQRNANWTEQWAEYEYCWKQSPGHWSVAKLRHKFIGVSSARGSNGVWYGCLIAVD